MIVNPDSADKNLTMICLGVHYGKHVQGWPAVACKAVTYKQPA